MREHMLWVEKYRPKTIQECILPDSFKTTFQEYVNRKEIPNMLFAGTTGIGKTTVAKALCEEVGCDYIMINGSDERGIGVMQNQVKNFATSMSFTGGRKVVIIDEADNLTPDAQKALRGMMEEVSRNCTFIFTCNFKARMLEAIQSRCVNVDFKLNGSKAKMAAQFFQRVCEILNEEGVTYSKEVVAAVITKHFPDNRRILNELQHYASNSNKTIDKGILAKVTDVLVDDLIKSLKDKDFSGTRKWIIANIDNDASRLYRKIYDALQEHLKPQSVPQLVLHLAKYQYQSAFVADQEINMIACLTEIMVDCEFK
jgi:DNA polymerase III delta prime subunit